MHTPVVRKDRSFGHVSSFALLGSAASRTSPHSVLQASSCTGRDADSCCNKEPCMMWPCLRSCSSRAVASKNGSKLKRLVLH
eukprot:40868-Amphidinium_carterae.1